MKTIALLTTGGTIAMQRQDSAGGALPTLEARDFQRALPADLPPLHAEAICNLPSAHLTLDHLAQLRARVLALIEDERVAGAVITHGTDTLEETAAYLDLTVEPGAPIVLTGAMRTASEPGYDGLANVSAAIRVAAHAGARQRGALVVLNDTIHLAREVTKTDPHAADAFVSPAAGPVGRIVAGDVTFYQPPFHGPVLPAGTLEPDVFLLKAAIAMPPELLRFLVERRTRGIVIEGLGACRVPPDWLDLVRQAVRQGTVVVITTRCLRGRVYDEYAYAAGYRDLKAAGCLFGDLLNGPKSRIKLMAILGQAQGSEEVGRLWRGT